MAVAVVRFVIEHVWPARSPCCHLGVNPQRYLDGFTWDEFKWRRGELEAQFKGVTVLAGVDDMDSFKGIELKLQVHTSGERVWFCWLWVWLTWTRRRSGSYAAAVIKLAYRTSIA